MNSTFIEYLQKNGYDTNDIEAKKYRYGNDVYEKIEIKDGEQIIQSFVIMNQAQYKKNPKFPFYRTYNQRNKYSNIVNPACFVAVDEGDDKWSIWNSKDTKEPKNSPSVLNYDEAVKRFNKRWESPGNEELYKTLRILTYVCLGFLLLYFAAYLLSANGLLYGIDVPLNSTVISVMAAIAILLILPPIMPYITSLTYKGTTIDLTNKRVK